MQSKRQTYNTYRQHNVSLRKNVSAKKRIGEKTYRRKNISAKKRIDEKTYRPLNLLRTWPTNTHTLFIKLS